MKTFIRTEVGSWNLCSLFKVLVSTLKEGGPFLCGNELGLIDYFFSSILYTKLPYYKTFLNWNLVESGFGELVSYSERVSSLPRFSPAFPSEKIDYLFISYFLSNAGANHPHLTDLEDTVNALERKECREMNLMLKEKEDRKEERKSLKDASSSYSSSGSSRSSSTKVLGAVFTGEFRVDKSGTRKPVPKNNNTDSNRSRKGKRKGKSVNKDEEDLLFCL
eukprot:CAMPEP_0204881556 /NCGR_PEP_ID=MMETSP1349-20130617/2797_1 /ASSEMBLY_ACC=CAM_ASM_000710 /TAXON_ID=215587 /ORGANISM="Aplanochytrium stocchinoi, Strain GSBS06" /LENGTH=219 /DNA_ID=CAMNT_0052040569 /DNA_START=257 /DNA_END=916 /DNA_ORIENTATION=+